MKASDQKQNPCNMMTNACRCKHQFRSDVPSGSTTRTASTTHISDDVARHGKCLSNPHVLQHILICCLSFHFIWKERRVKVVLSFSCPSFDHLFSRSSHSTHENEFSSFHPLLFLLTFSFLLLLSSSFILSLDPEKKRACCMLRDD